ncbi:ABC transporter ATP-binding protein [Brachybacterium hainanense]|uniref:ABC transporter ATP-binding protein n=1 Tax=Brachybacterium hainanense TaxID=1541174 RepID=A0ABV6RJX3_9MICO
MSTAEPPGIQVDGVSRAFGAVQAVAGLSLTAPQGQVTALVGPNGCGKSTLMLMLASLLAPDAGSIRILGHDPQVDTDATRRAVGWMPDQFGAWDSLQVAEVLEVMGRAYFLPRPQLRERIGVLLEQLDLASLARTPAHVLSRGQKQRLGLARALVHAPQVLILDEPASGLDPAARKRLLGIVRGFAADGGTVLVSSHILTELEEMADRVVFMDQGRQTGQASLQELAERPQRWRVRSLDASSLWRALDAAGVHRGRVHRTDPEPEGYAEVTLDLPDEKVAALLLADLVTHDGRIVGFGPAAGRLESAYLASEAARRQGAL